MKKEKALKYLILTFTLIISFFMFSNASVKAIETKGVEIIDNLFFEVEEIETGKYSIVGVYNTCNGDTGCLQSISSVENLVIPDVYDDGENVYPIVSIKDGADAVSGVLKDLATVVSGKISGGSNLLTIGKCAFCDFTKVTEIDVSSSVTLIKNNAFSGSGIEIVVINRYDGSSENEKITAIESVEAFNGVTLKNIVFKNSDILRYYRDSVDVWKELNLSSKFTFRITYRFYDGEGNYEDRVYLSGEELGEIPVNLTKIGFDFGGWVSKEFENEEITSSSKAAILNSNNTLIHEVEPKWKLSAPELVMEAFYNGVKDDDYTIVYGGKNNKLDLVVEADHVLGQEDGFVITYSWESNINSLITPIENNNTNSHSINFVSQSGVYKCYVTLSYLNYTETFDVSHSAEVIAKDLIVNVNDNSTVYGTYASAGRLNESHYVIDSSTSLVEGEIVKDYRVDLYTNNNSDIDVGEYENVLGIEFLNIGSENNEDNYLYNYNIQYNYGDLTVTKRKIDVSLTGNINVIYGEPETLNKTVNDVIYAYNTFAGFNKYLVIEYVRSNVGVKDAGEYTVVDAIVDNTNYEVYFDNNSEYRIVINPKQVNVDWNIEQSLVYDGNEKNITASYKDVANQTIELKVTIKQNNSKISLVNAGEYVAVAEMITSNNNYQLVNGEKTIFVEKAESEFTGDLRQVKVYNGQSQRVDVSLNHHEGTIKYGDYSNCKNAHVSSEATCVITVSVEETDNYKAKVSNFYLHIDPYKLIVEPDLFRITYGTRIGIDNLNKRYNGVNGENVIVYFYKEGVSADLDVGVYNVGGANLSNNTNYIVEMIPGSGANKIEIVPSPVEVRFYFYENLVYDGLVKEIGVRVFGTEEDVGLQIDYNGKSVIKNAGNYRLKATLANDNYYIDGDDCIDFTIAKADYDISNLKLNSKEVNFNFKNHFINLEGELPEGLSVKYSINGNKGNGTLVPSKHTVKVIFEGDYENYNYVEPMTAVLYIDMTWVWIVLSLFVVIVGGLITTLVILIKTGKVRLINRLKRSKIRKIIKRNRELDEINELIARAKNDLKSDEDENLIIEESVKFVKNPVKVSPEELIQLSFVDELFRSEIATKHYYSEVKNELLSYEGIVSKIKRDYETFYLNNMPVAKLDVVSGVLHVYFALDPTLYREEEYNHENAGKQKDFAAVPLHLKVNSIESLRHAKMFIRIIRKREKIKFVSNFIRTDYVKVYTAKDNSFRLFKKVFSKKNSKED